MCNAHGTRRPDSHTNGKYIQPPWEAAGISHESRSTLGAVTRHFHVPAKEEALHVDEVSHTKKCWAKHVDRQTVDDHEKKKNVRCPQTGNDQIN